jgi:hypothetical protein
VCVVSSPAVNDLLGVLSDFGGNGDCTTTAPAPAPTPAPLWCPDSPMLQCRMMCPEAVPCPAGQCNMRQGTCCASECQVFEAPAECNGCCPPGAACFAPDPPCCAAQAQPEPACTQGTDCGGQVWNDCGSSCPSICGEPDPMMCNMMCNQAYECPFGECFNEATGACEAGGGGGGGTLPPGIAAGRPFLNAAKLAPVKAVSYSVVSDWATEL